MRYRVRPRLLRRLRLGEPKKGSQKGDKSQKGDSPLFLHRFSLIHSPNGGRTVEHALSVVRGIRQAPRSTTGPTSAPTST